MGYAVETILPSSNQIKIKISNTLKFVDYSIDELMNIAELMARKRQYEITLREEGII